MRRALVAVLAMGALTLSCARENPFRPVEGIGEMNVTTNIIPRFEPPAGLSPAACRYVLDMGLSQAAFTAAVVSLGVKGHLTI